MARFKRIHRPGLIYHIVNRGNNRQAIFLEGEDYEKYLGLLYRYKLKFQFKIFAYCLMTNHVHLLIQTGEASISKIMQCITNAHTRHYHFKYRTGGHVWQGRFSSPIVSDDEYLLTVMQYIEQNPVRAGMAVRIEDYRWFSYLLNVRADDSKLIDRWQNPIFKQLNAGQKDAPGEYARMMKTRLDMEKADAVRASLKNGAGYMSERFKAQMAEMLPRKRVHGRPRRTQE